MDGSNIYGADDTERMKERYATLRKQLVRRERIEKGQGGAAFYAAQAYGSVLEESAMLQKATHAAKLFCIAAVFVVPNLLVIHVLL